MEVLHKVQTDSMPEQKSVAAESEYIENATTAKGEYSSHDVETEAPDLSTTNDLDNPLKWPQWRVSISFEYNLSYRGLMNEKITERCESRYDILSCYDDQFCWGWYHSGLFDFC